MAFYSSKGYVLTLVTDPEEWNIEELRRWLRAVSLFLPVSPLMLTVSQRGLLPDDAASRDDLLERVKANMRSPLRSSS
jgi:hypothetical protein